MGLFKLEQFETELLAEIGKPSDTLGLTWALYDNIPPNSSPWEDAPEALRTALEQKKKRVIMFTPDEWNEFGVSSPKPFHYIKTSRGPYRPVDAAVDAIEELYANYHQPDLKQVRPKAFVALILEKLCEMEDAATAAWRLKAFLTNHLDNIQLVTGALLSSRLVSTKHRPILALLKHLCDDDGDDPTTLQIRKGVAESEGWMSFLGEKAVAADDTAPLAMDILHKALRGQTSACTALVDKWMASPKAATEEAIRDLAGAHVSCVVDALLNHDPTPAKLLKQIIQTHHEDCTAEQMKKYATRLLTLTPLPDSIPHSVVSSLLDVASESPSNRKQLTKIGLLFGTADVQTTIIIMNQLESILSGNIEKQRNWRAWVVQQRHVQVRRLTQALDQNRDLAEQIVKPLIGYIAAKSPDDEDHKKVRMGIATALKAIASTPAGAHIAPHIEALFRAFAFVLQDSESTTIVQTALDLSKTHHDTIPPDSIIRLLETSTFGSSKMDVVEISKIKQRWQSTAMAMAATICKNKESAGALAKTLAARVATTVENINNNRSWKVVRVMYANILDEVVKEDASVMAPHIQDFLQSLRDMPPQISPIVVRMMRSFGTDEAHREELKQYVTLATSLLQERQQMGNAQEFVAVSMLGEVLEHYPPLRRNDDIQTALATVLKRLGNMGRIGAAHRQAALGIAKIVLNGSRTVSSVLLEVLTQLERVSLKLDPEKKPIMDRAIESLSTAQTRDA